MTTIHNIFALKTFPSGYKLMLCPTILIEFYYDWKSSFKNAKLQNSSKLKVPENVTMQDFFQDKLKTSIKRYLKFQEQQNIKDYAKKAEFNGNGLRL